MASRPEIKPQMQVLTSERAFLGTVDRVEGDGIRINLARAGEGQQTLPLSWVERVDEHVHLNRAGAEIEVGLKAAQFAQSGKPAAKPASAASPAATAGGKQVWIWAVAAVIILLLLILLF
ncbi:MAG TPA: DUF2171 domain-containing protein [Allosphingosinicella sp.]|jgi:hypothetical protein